MDGAVFQPAFIINRQHDYAWFLLLPFAAILFALTAHQHLPGGALVAITLWITVPHFLLTGLRVYGSSTNFERWRERLIMGPIALIIAAFLLIKYAPLTLVLLVLLWDNQHSLMQQHGFARIYDFKARAGAAGTKNFDLAFNWVFFGNMLIVSPLFSTIWIRTLYEWSIPIQVAQIELIQTLSWSIAGLYGLVYIGHNIWCVRNGYKLNPYKFFFLFSSYFLWYYTSFTSQYIMVYAIAHRIMHGLQYIAIIYSFNRQTVVHGASDSSLLTDLAQPKNFKVFLLLCALSTLVWLALTEGSIAGLGFGLIGYGADTDLFSYSLVSSIAMIHYYFDAFIWKVRQPETQKGL